MSVGKINEWRAVHLEAFFGSWFLGTELQNLCQGPQDHPQVSSFTGSTRDSASSQSYPWLWFITAKSTGNKGAWDGVRREPGAYIQESSPSGVIQDALNSSSNEPWQRVWNTHQGSPSEIPGFFLAAGHIATLCLACTKIPDFQKEVKCSS